MTTHFYRLLITAMLTVSVIIPSLYSPIIDRVVECLRAQTCPPLEIIVVGMDRAGRLAGRTDLHFIDTGRPISPAAARNAGAKLACGDIYCFIDADCLAAPDWIERMVARHVIRRALFESIGGFDERFNRLAGEDTDLSFRLRRQGHTLLFDPCARVTHCPSRDRVRHMWAHFHLFGATYPILQRQHGDLIGRSLRVILCQRLPWLAVLLSPFLALLDSLTFYKRNPALLRYWYALPGITLARLAWYIGLTFGSDSKELV